MCSKRPCRLFVAVLLILLVAGCVHQATVDPANLADDVKLLNYYSDNMLFQQEQPVVLKGMATPGKIVVVEMNGESEAVTAGKDGIWKAELPPQPVGGPYLISIKGKKTLTLKNVLVGELWICSGQSNMAFQAGECISARKDLASATFPSIRFFTIKCRPVPVDMQNDIEPLGSWVECTPQSAAAFSGVGFFFGRKLYQDLKVPVGLINSSVGGTCIETWMPLAAHASQPEFKYFADQAVNQPGKECSEEKFYQSIKDWLDKLENNEYKEAVEKGKANAIVTATGLDSWENVEMPNFFEYKRIAIDGVIWLARTVELPADWAGKNLTLSLGVIDDCDTTYFNGQKVGETSIEVREHWSVKRSYQVPGKLVKAGTNILSIRVLDHAYNGGMTGPSQEMYLRRNDAAEVLTLSGTWKCKIEYVLDYEKVVRRPNPPDSSNTNYPCALYNGMINGLTDLPVRGAIWYQGESNCGSDLYGKQFSVMIEYWRKAWKNPEMAFMFVQLAAFERHTPGTPLPDGYFASLPPGDSSWARTREAQSAALSLPNTGMAVAIDIGDPIDIHPANKQDVGIRLALAAENRIYGKDVVCSGPVYKSMVVEGNRIRVNFSDVGGGLVAKNGPLKQFAIAGADRKFYWAKAELHNGYVLVSAPEVKAPVAVRYAWSNYPDGCNLYNREGLPAVPFRTDNW